jgi:hypothetical protein
VAIFCSLTATKTCQPDGTWGACHEEPGRTNTSVLLGDAGVAGLFTDAGTLAFLDGGIPGLAAVPASLGPLLGDAGLALGDAGLSALLTNGPCRTVYHGCEPLLGQRETFAGDCSKAFTCQRPPQ